MISVIIAAGGKGTRMGHSENKVFINLCGKEIIAHTLKAFENHPEIDEIIVVCGEGEHQRVAQTAHENNISKFRISTTGGTTRQESVYAGLAFAQGDYVLIHDGARALIGSEEITRVIADVKKYGAAALGVVCKDTLKQADENGFIKGTLNRETTYHIQTPQAFKKEEIIKAYNKAISEGFIATDDCMIAENDNIRIKITQGSYENIKITTPEDIATAQGILEKRRK